MSLKQQNGNVTNVPRKEGETPKPFKLDGKPLDLRRVSPLAEKMMRFLNAQPKDELFRPQSLATALNSTPESLSTALYKYEALSPYSTNLLRPQRAKVYGHPKAIAALKRELGVE